MTFVILLVVMLLQLLPLCLVQQPPKQTTKAPSKDAHLFTDASLLETGQATKLRQPTQSNELKIVSYNIRWRSGDDLKQLIKLFHDDAEIGGPSIIALQEVDRRKKRSGQTNTIKLLAEELGLYYVWAAPPTANADDEEETGVAILSVYPLLDIHRIVLPHEGPGGRHRVAVGACVKLNNTELRIYSAHAETRISMDEKLDQLSSLVEDLNQHSATVPAIIMGDLNTWQSDAGKKTIKLFTDAGFVTPFGGEKTFSRKVMFVPIEFHLDWIWMRGVEATQHGIDRQINISDHWPLWTTVKLRTIDKR